MGVSSNLSGFSNFVEHNSMVQYALKVIYNQPPVTIPDIAEHTWKILRRQSTLFDTIGVFINTRPTNWTIPGSAIRGLVAYIKTIG
jgi:hypothetical protein